MAFPLIPVALGAAGIGVLYWLSKAQNTSAPAAPQALPPGQAVIVPPTPAPQLAAPPLDRPPGVSEQVFLTYLPGQPSLIQQAQAIRYLEIENLFPFELSGPDDPAFVQGVSGFQSWVKLPVTGRVDTQTQAELDRSVAAKNAVLHNKNVAAGLPDADWVTEQNRLGAADSRGAWRVGAIVMASIDPKIDDMAITQMQRDRY